MGLNKEYIVVKNNILNEMRAGFTIGEYRLFCTFLSRINPKNAETNKVQFSLAEYSKLMELNRPKRGDIEPLAKRLVEKSVKLEEPNGGFGYYCLFTTFRLIQNDDKIWIVDIACHPDLTPYLFENKKRFFKYKLYNTIYLNSYNQMRIYELLKQYEKIGEREISLEALFDFLGIKPQEWIYFRRDVILVAQKALEENTDIKFEFKRITKGKKTVAVKFFIFHNENFLDQLRIENFISMDDVELDEDEGFTLENNIQKFESKSLEFLAEACNFEFTETEMQVLFDLVAQIVPAANKSNGENLQLLRYDYLLRKYNELKYRAEKNAEENNPIKNRFGYLKRIIESEAEAIRQYT